MYIPPNIDIDTSISKMGSYTLAKNEKILLKRLRCGRSQALFFLDNLLTINYYKTISRNDS